jgi:cell wall-associated NlpC family hydrolase
VRRTARRALLWLEPCKRTREAPISTGTSGGIGIRLISVVLILALAVLLLGQIAWAEPAAITKAKSEAVALQERIDELAEQLDAAVEDYNYARAKLSETKAAAEANQNKLAKAEKDLKVLQERLTERVVEIYKQSNLSMVATLAECDSFSELVNRLDLLERLSQQDASMFADVITFRDDVSQRKVELATQLEQEKVLAEETKVAKKKVEERLAANEKALAGKEAQIAQLQKEEAERQARLAAAAREAARKAAAEKAAALKAAEKARQAAAAAQNSKSSSASKATSNTVASAPSSDIGGDVVSIAMRYLGVPYVWAGSSPSGFDCSGFVMYVFGKAGVSLPHSSRIQAGYGVPVSRSNLQPGDLVFFYSPIHHVAIYIGGGQMIHAAGSGKDVRISAVWNGSYNCARRILCGVAYRGASVASKEAPQCRVALSRRSRSQVLHLRSRNNKRTSVSSGLSIGRV